MHAPWQRVVRSDYSSRVILLSILWRQRSNRHWRGSTYLQRVKRPVGSIVFSQCLLPCSAGYLFQTGRRQLSLHWGVAVQQQWPSEFSSSRCSQLSAEKRPSPV